MANGRAAIGLLGVGCVFTTCLAAGAAAAAWLLVANPAPAPTTPIAPVALGAPDAGTPACPVRYDTIMVFVRLEHVQFLLESTAGESYPMRYEGSAYPHDALRARLEERRAAEPHRRDLYVTAEPGIPGAVIGRVLRDASEVGFTDALLCTDTVDPLAALTGDGPAVAPPPEDPMAALGGLMGDPVPAEDEGTIGLGNLGTIGSGYGRGAGGLHGSGPVPRVRASVPEVRGSLASDVIRRVVRRHMSEVTFCYEQHLGEQPELAGRLVVRAVIAASGSVASSEVVSTTLGEPRVGECIATAMRRWTYPAPEGGGVVIYEQTLELSSE